MLLCEYTEPIHVMRQKVDVNEPQNLLKINILSSTSRAAHSSQVEREEKFSN